MKKVKLIEGDKNKLVIDAEELNNGMKYTFAYNNLANIDWSGFKKVKMINTQTDESEEYKKLILMRNPKDNKDIYLYPSDAVELFEPNSVYHLDNWLFADDVRVKSHQATKSLNEMANKVNTLVETVDKLVQYQVGKSVEVKQKEVEKQMVLLKEIQDLIGTIKTPINLNTWRSQVLQPMYTMADTQPHHMGIQNQQTPSAMWSSNNQPSMTSQMGYGTVNPFPQAGEMTNQFQSSMTQPTNTSTNYVKNW